MTPKKPLPRRRFLQTAASMIGVAATPCSWPAVAGETPGAHPNDSAIAADRDSTPDPFYPRRFRGNQSKMISFPLGGVAAGSIGLGGRGELKNWEIFNRPNIGFRPSVALPSIWAQAGNKTVARVLEARILPPYEGQDGVGSTDMPGLSRLESATFIGEYPLAHIDFEDRTLPVKVELEAFSPFIPHEPDDSGLPVAILRYCVTNPGSMPTSVSIAFSIDNPVSNPASPATATQKSNSGRVNEFRTSPRFVGLSMTNPELASDDPMAGEFVLAATPETGARVSYWEGWPGDLWSSPLLFWDQFSEFGEMGAQPEVRSAVGVLCLTTSIKPGQTAQLQFLLGWRFPNRTPDWCGWKAPKGEGKTIIGNFYSARFKTAWEAMAYTVDNLDSLESRTRNFAKALRESTIPAVIKEAASTNLSTLATTTCFRTADGEFHGFEGSNDSKGCCFGNCTHVWNYETATAFLFPSFAHSLRRGAFGYSMDDAGAIHFRQLLPDGKERSGFAAADGQMGQIMHAWLDWKISGDDALLRSTWPGAKKALEFAWVHGGWDADRDGVMEGVQHNTYDVEFYGPNPMCGIYYLGGLRAGEEMARAAGDTASADTYRQLFEQGSRWIDGNLFNGEYYIQQIRGYRKEEIAESLLSGMGSKDTLHPEYQVGAGCLVDQLVGQYLADICGLGPLLSTNNIRTALQSIFRYNYKRSLSHYENTERAFALNEEASVIICDYGRGKRPQVPFPYFSETMTGFEYTAAALMMHWGMVEEGLECVRNIRLRYDGEKRNPWDEAECGHHYARAMSSWSAVVALSGFRYDARDASIIAIPLTANREFQCFWSTGTGWGTYSLRHLADRVEFAIKLLNGTLACRSCELVASGKIVEVKSGGKVLEHQMHSRGKHLVMTLDNVRHFRANDELRIEVFG